MQSFALRCCRDTVGTLHSLFTTVAEYLFGACFSGNRRYLVEHTEKGQTMSWKWEMNDGSKWVSNGLRFATEQEARAYGVNLSMRWFSPIAAVNNCRATECEDAVTENNAGAFKPAGHRVQL